MKIGFIGLGRMGLNMVTRLQQGGHEVVVFNRSKEPIKKAGAFGAVGAESVEDLVDKLPEPKIVWFMLPAGEITQNYIDQVAPLLKPNDIIINGANAYYKDSIKLAENLKDMGVHILDIGVSGGVWGLEIGYCMMAGGPEVAFKTVEPMLKTLAPKDGYAYMGKSGSGHYVKMVHNGIEYAMMQAYAEGFEIMKAKKEFNLDLEKIAHLWNQGSVIRSWLLELAENIFREDQEISNIEGYVEDSGEGRWTVWEAMEEDVPAPTIILSLLKRFRSRQKESYSDKFLAALRNQFGGHAVKEK